MRDGPNSKKPDGYLIMGRHSVEEAVTHSSERVLEVFLAESKQERSSRFASLVSKLEKLKVPIRYLQAHELTRLVNSDSHQSVVAKLTYKTPLSLESLIKKLKSVDKALLLLLDSIDDPHNFGAILRSAECFGVSAVIWSKNRGCDITPAVTKVSVGASELLDLVPVSNLHTAARTLKENNFWLVGTVLDSEAKSLVGFEFPEKTALIMGSEESGIQQLLVKELDFKVYIPMQGKIASLNVSQATAVALSHYRWGEGIGEN